MPVTWSDEKLILLHCPWGLNSRPSARRSLKHDQGEGVLRANHSATAATSSSSQYCAGQRLAPHNRTLGDLEWEVESTTVTVNCPNFGRSGHSNDSCANYVACSGPIYLW